MYLIKCMGIPICGRIRGDNLGTKHIGIGINNSTVKSGIKTQLTGVARRLHNNISPDYIQSQVVSDVTFPA